MCTISPIIIRCSATPEEQSHSHPQDTRTVEQRGSLLALIHEPRIRSPTALVVGHQNLDPLKACPCYHCVAEYTF